MLISSSIFSFLDSTRVTVHDSPFKIIISYLVLDLGAAPQFTLCLKQAFTLDHLPLDRLPLTNGGPEQDGPIRDICTH